ncbi:MAG: hypothetical protein AB2693_15420, partial [Candidatus Thiodiazotropha sp.]
RLIIHAALNFTYHSAVCVCDLLTSNMFIAGKKPIDGARCSIDCTVNPKLAGVTGIYFADFKREQPSNTAR